MFRGLGFRGLGFKVQGLGGLVFRVNLWVMFPHPEP